MQALQHLEILLSCLVQPKGRPCKSGFYIKDGHGLPLVLDSMLSFFFAFNVLVCLELEVCTFYQETIECYQ